MNNNFNVIILGLLRYLNERKMLCYCRKEELNELLILSGNLRGTTKLKLYAVMRGTIQIELKFGLMAGISIRRGICIDFRFADLDSCVLK